MPPNKNRPPKKSRERKARVASTGDESTPLNDRVELLTGNEEKKDTFVNIDEPAAAAAAAAAQELNLSELAAPEANIVVVTGQPAKQPNVEHNGQQVDVGVADSGDANQNDDHIVISVEAEQDLHESSMPPLRTPSPSGFSIEDEESLSANLTRLTTPNGAEVLLIGTAHFSLKSVQDVRRVVQSVKPSSVILELCRERAFMLSLDEQSLLEQNKSLSIDKVRNAIAEKGIAHGLIYIMFIKMSASLTEKLGMAPGAEFRAGSAEAQKIPGCSVVLADRSLRTTIARAVASVSLWQKMKLIYHVLMNDVNITQEDVEKCKDKDMLEQLLEELGGQFPGFKRVLLDERNIYLAHSIYKWAENSETTLGPPRVVAIVGIGHVAGIVENWGKTTDEQIHSLNEVPKTSRTEIVVKKTIKYCAFALLIYIGYRIFTPSHIQAGICAKLAENYHLCTNNKTI